jgi:ACR3 family arsenite efflux pump ArsB
MTTTASPDEPAVIGQLSTLDRLLPIWSLAAMGVGLGPLIEVPVLVALVYLPLWLRRTLPTTDRHTTTAVGLAGEGP